MPLTLGRKSLKLAFKKLDGDNKIFLPMDSFFFIRVNIGPFIQGTGFLSLSFLQQGDTLTLEKAQTLGRVIGNAKKDSLLLGGEKSQSFPAKYDVNQINKYDRTPTLSNAKTKSCFRCGRDDHLANDDKCRAKGAWCRKCKKTGHYANYCRSSGAEKEEHEVKAVQLLFH